MPGQPIPDPDPAHAGLTGDCVILSGLKKLMLNYNNPGLQSRLQDCNAVRLQRTIVYVPQNRDPQSQIEATRFKDYYVLRPLR
jgi:hypothetical protein